MSAVLVLSVDPPALEARRRGELDEALVLEGAGPGLWRVCDSRLTDGSDRLLALVEAKADQFEVMQLADQFRWSTFPTMRAALSFVVNTHAEVLAARPAGRTSWLG